ncbi:MAG: hypothetical protein ACLTAO_13695, partial [Christensenellales bacterium]
EGTAQPLVLDSVRWLGYIRSVHNPKAAPQLGPKAAPSGAPESGTKQNYIHQRKNTYPKTKIRRRTHKSASPTVKS